MSGVVRTSVDILHVCFCILLPQHHEKKSLNGLGHPMEFFHAQMQLWHRNSFSEREGDEVWIPRLGDTAISTYSTIIIKMVLKMSLTSSLSFQEQKLLIFSHLASWSPSLKNCRILTTQVHVHVLFTSFLSIPGAHCTEPLNFFFLYIILWGRDPIKSSSLGKILHS